MDAAIAEDTRAHLNRLADGLLLEIIEQPCLSVQDLVSLARTSRRHYSMAISAAYKKHVNDEFGLAIYLSIYHGQHATLKRLFSSGVNVDMLNEEGSPVDIEAVITEHKFKYEFFEDFF